MFVCVYIYTYVDRVYKKRTKKLSEKKHEASKKKRMNWNAKI